MRAGFLELGGSETNGDLFGGETEVRAGDGGADAFPRFGNSFASHANDIETG